MKVLSLLQKAIPTHLLLGLSVLLTAMCVSPWVLRFVVMGLSGWLPSRPVVSCEQSPVSISLSLKQGTYLIVTLCAKEQLEILALGLGSLAPRVFGCVS